MIVEPGQQLILRTDGASRGNPGPAAAGVIIEAADGKLIARGGHYLGEITNNQAEYRALIFGLKAVARYQPSAVEVYLDSDLLVNQLNGRYQVRDAGLRPLFEEARRLAQALSNVRFSHVPRALNHLADAEANKALNAARKHSHR
jgi:ribonuclease HI